MQLIFTRDKSGIVLIKLQMVKVKCNNAVFGNYTDLWSDHALELIGRKFNLIADFLNLINFHLSRIHSISVSEQSINCMGKDVISFKKIIIIISI